MSSKRLSLGTHFLSSKKKEDLSDLFTSFDRDQDGKISRNELSDMLLSAGVDSAAIPSMLRDVQSGKEKDGSLDFDDFTKLMRPTLSDPHRNTTKQQELREAFEAFDKDGDGAINVTELQAMMEKLGDKISLQEAQLLIEEVDLDKNGSVNFYEFCIMMGVQKPVDNSRSIGKRSECPHNHHRYSVRRFFCSHNK